MYLVAFAIVTPVTGKIRLRNKITEGIIRLRSESHLHRFQEQLGKEANIDQTERVVLLSYQKLE